MQTWMWVDDSGRRRASLDLLSLPLLAKIGGTVSLRRAALVGSVVVVPEDQRNGYASALLSEVFRRHPDLDAFLYSDIEPRFYERFGFRACPMVAVETAPYDGIFPKAEPLAPAEFARALETLRRERLQSMSGDGGVVLPDELWLDWFAERYRYFGELASQPFRETGLWRMEHNGEGHLFAAWPDAIASRLDVGWMEACPQCELFAHGLTRHYALRALKFWKPVAGAAMGKRELPMLRLHDAAGALTFLDPQYIDSW